MHKVSRRLLLAGAATAPVAAALPTLAAASPDAAYLSEFAARLAEWNAPDNDDSEAVAASWDRLAFLSDAPVFTLPGAVAKLALACDQAHDHHQINHADEHLPRTLASLRASATALPLEERASLDWAAEWIESIARDWSNDSTARWKAEADAKEWRRLDDIFERTGTNARTEENRRASMAEPRGDDGLSDSERRLRTAIRKLTDDEQRTILDSMTLLVLANRVRYALEELAERGGYGRDVLESIANDFAAAARRSEGGADDTDA